MTTPYAHTSLWVEKIPSRSDSIAIHLIGIGFCMDCVTINRLVFSHLSSGCNSSYWPLDTIALTTINGSVAEGRAFCYWRQNSLPGNQILKTAYVFLWEIRAALFWTDSSSG
jgi:hypothetical protein